MTREDNCEANRRYEYTYDWRGNITSKKEYELDTGTLLSTKSYTYRSSGWTDQLIGYNGESISYDAIGNPTSYLGHSLSWSNVRRLSSYDGNTFSYNASGIRTKKNNITYTLDGSRILREERSEGTLTYYYGVEGLTGFRYNGVDYYYRKNLQGDIIGIINAVGTELVSYSYDAWGNILWTEDDSGRNLAELNPYRYRGYYYDTETGLYYLNSRYYDPKVGRFLNADAMNYLKANAFTGVNLYSYCDNNPVMFMDPDGHFPILTAIAVLVVLFCTPVGGAIVQTASSVLSYAGIAIASIFSEDIRNDMNRIGWNPFNSDESLVLESKAVAFYKGVPVFRINGKRSGSFCALFLDKRANKDDVRHEFGHVFQQLCLGPLPYGLFIGLPSWLQWSNRDYYERPWEVTADLFGGVEGRRHTTSDSFRGLSYLMIAALFGPFAYLFLLGEY